MKLIGVAVPVGVAIGVAFVGAGVGPPGVGVKVAVMVGAVKVPVGVTFVGVGVAPRGVGVKVAVMVAVGVGAIGFELMGLSAKATVAQPPLFIEPTSAGTTPAVPRDLSPTAAPKFEPLTYCSIATALRSGGRTKAVFPVAKSPR